MIENQNAGVTQKKKKYGRLKDFICFSVAAFISFSQVSPIWAAEGTRVFDEAGLFSAEEVQELETRIDEVRDSQDADLAVLTVEDAQGESAESYADDFYDSHGLGVGDDASGILLSIDMDNREIYVSTTGYAMKVLTDALETCKSSTRFNLQEEPITTFYFDHKKVIDALATVNGE